MADPFPRTGQAVPLLGGPFDGQSVPYEDKKEVMVQMPNGDKLLHLYQLRATMNGPRFLYMGGRRA